MQCQNSQLTQECSVELRRQRKHWPVEKMEDLVEGQNWKGPRPEGFVVRFWRKVDKNGPIPERCPELGCCWTWIGEINKTGRPVISICNLPWLAYRISFLIHNKYLDDNLFVMHLCDNPICVNPAHLKLGPPKENTQYAIKGKRMLLGEKNGQHTLSEKQVVEIRNRYDSGEKVSTIAKDFPHVWLPCVWRVAKRMRWKHIP